MATKVKKEDAVATKLKEFRSQVVNMTQKEFAEKLETTQANISQIEAGTCLPSGQYILRLTENFPDIDLNWLFFDEGFPLRQKVSSKGKKSSEEILKEYDHLLKNFVELNRHLAGKPKKK